MYGMNKVIVLGRLGSDPEVRYTKDGAAMATLSIATNRRIKRDGNTWEEITDWHKAICFNRRGEICKEYLSKGDKVLVEGRLQTRKWTDKEGKNRYITEIVVEGLRMLGGAKGKQGAKPSNGEQRFTHRDFTDSPGESAEEVPF